MEENKFDFKFLNKMMYIFAIVVVFFALKEFGILAKIGSVLASLMPFYVGVIICWISKPLANKIRKIGLSKGLSAVIALVIIFAIIFMCDVSFPLVIIFYHSAVKNASAIFYFT